MKRERIGLPALALLGIVAVAVMGASGVAAREHGRAGAHVNRGPVRPVPTRTVVHRAWVPGHYEIRRERVLLEPAHYRTRWVSPVVAERRGRHGRRYTVVVRDGYHEKIRVPARHEYRQVKVWVPGHHVDVPTVAHHARRRHSYPARHHPPQRRGSRFNLGVLFRF